VAFAEQVVRGKERKAQPVLVVFFPGVRGVQIGITEVHACLDQPFDRTGHRHDRKIAVMTWLALEQPRTKRAYLSNINGRCRSWQTAAGRSGGRGEVGGAARRTALFNQDRETDPVAPTARRRSVQELELMPAVPEVADRHPSTWELIDAHHRI
jgi:hypothetical protein